MGILALDDRDPSIIYSAGWAQAGSANEYNKTTSWTAVAGSTAKVTFVGTSIGVYGTIPAKKGAASVAPVSAYSVDGGAPTLFQSTEAGRAQFSQLFYQSPVLADGTHTLTIAHPAISDPFFLDYLLVLQGEPSTPTVPIGGVSTGITNTSTTSTALSTTSTTSTTTSLTTSLPGTTSTTSTLTSTSSTPPATTVTVISTAPNTTPTSDVDSASANGANTNSASSSHTGAIVGGIIGAIIFLFLLGFGLIIWRRKRRDRRTSMIASNFWNTGTTGSSSTPAKSFAPSATVASSQMSNNAPIMAQTTGGSAGYGNPRYPGGYAPAPPPTQAPPYGGYAPYAYPSHAESGYYSQGYTDQVYQGGGGGGGYIPPSQLLNANLNAGSDYSHGR